MPPCFDIAGPCAIPNGSTHTSGTPCLRRRKPSEGRMPDKARTVKRVLCEAERFSNGTLARHGSWTDVHEAQAAWRRKAAYCSIPHISGSERGRVSNTPVRPSVWSKHGQNAAPRTRCSLTASMPVVMFKTDVVAQGMTASCPTGESRLAIGVGSARGGGTVSGQVGLPLLPGVAPCGSNRLSFLVRRGPILAQRHHKQRGGTT